MMMLMSAVITFSSCSSDDEAFYTAGENDYPKILNSDLLDFDGMSGGKAFNLPGINRDQPFSYEVIVTPTQFTDVTWFVDGEQITEGVSGEHGTKIETMLLAGTHEVKIVATTTKGKETSRTCKIAVNLLDSDPSIPNRPAIRTMVPGTTKEVKCSNTTNISSVAIGETEVSNLMTSEGKITFDVPNLPYGDYDVMITLNDGSKIPAGVFTLAEKEIEEGFEATFFEGSYDVTWETPFNELAATSKELVADGTIHEGAILRVYVEGTNGQGTAASAWWNNILTGLGDPNRGDIAITGEQVLEFKLNATSLQLINEQDGLFIVGNGYTIKKVTIEPKEKVWYEGSFDVTWGTPFNELASQSKEFVADNTIKVGTILRVYVDGANGQGTAASGWWNNILTGFGDPNRGDITITGEQVLEFVLNETSLQIINDQDGLFVVGNGYTIKKITLE